MANMITRNVRQISRYFSYNERSTILNTMNISSPIFAFINHQHQSPPSNSFSYLIGSFLRLIKIRDVLYAQLMLCSPLILHWTVRMDFTVLFQLKLKRLSHIERLIRYSPSTNSFSALMLFLGDYEKRKWAFMYMLTLINIGLGRGLLGWTVLLAAGFGLERFDFDSSRREFSSPDYQRIFLRLSLSPRSRRFDVLFPPFSSVSKSPISSNPVYGVRLVRKGLKLSDPRGLKNLTFCLPYSTVYDV